MLEPNPQRLQQALAIRKIAMESGAGEILRRLDDEADREATEYAATATQALVKNAAARVPDEKRSGDGVDLMLASVALRARKALAELDAIGGEIDRIGQVDEELAERLRRALYMPAVESVN